MLITAIDPGSPAERVGIRVGETLTAVGRHPTHDVLDYQFYTYDACLSLTLTSEDGSKRVVRVRKEEGEPLGLTFETYLADRARRCSNSCIFCFIDQLPKGMRDTLYFKDDDMRLSFLQGNYISMTNLSDEDLDRIIRMRISPLNISVQTTDPELRVRMLRNPRACLIMEQLNRLAEARVTMNCQIVVCPGVNDGEALDKSLHDLIALYPAVSSISVVPVGITKHREGLYPLKAVGEQEAAAILDVAEPIGGECLEKYGSRVVYCSDELYLRAKRPMPPAPYYEEFPQLENGVGMMALFEEEMRLAMEDMEPVWHIPPFSLATGCAAADFMRKMLDLAAKKCHNMEYTVYAIRNDFFGETVDVAGLVTGGDLIAQLRGKPLGKRLFIPGCMLRHGENVFLDDVTLEDASAALGVPIIPLSNDAQALIDALCAKD